jgi:ribosomal protein L15E
MNLREWLASLQDAESQSSVEGFTRAELAEKLGISDRNAIVVIREQFRKGNLVMSGKRQIPTIDGRLMWVPVYRAVQKQEPVAPDGAGPNA